MTINSVRVGDYTYSVQQVPKDGKLIDGDNYYKNGALIVDDREKNTHKILSLKKEKTQA